jgi:hypothetical protein
MGRNIRHEEEPFKKDGQKKWCLFAYTLFSFLNVAPAEEQHAIFFT